MACPTRRSAAPTRWLLWIKSGRWSSAVTWFLRPGVSWTTWVKMPRWTPVSHSRKQSVAEGSRIMKEFSLFLAHYCFDFILIVLKYINGLLLSGDCFLDDCIRFGILFRRNSQGILRSYAILMLNAQSTTKKYANNFC